MIRDFLGFLQDTAEAVQLWFYELDGVAAYRHFRRDCRMSRFRALWRTLYCLA